MVVKTLLRAKLGSALFWLRSSDVIGGLGLSVVVGVASGFSAIALRWLIENCQAAFFDGGASFLSFLGQYYVIIIPVVGGLLAGPLIYYFAREAKGHGVPEVMEAVALKGGRIRPQVAFVKAIASALTIGSGGSAGSEGPVIQIASAAGSNVGKWFRLPDERVKTLVACGAAGGVSAIFNAPIAGIFFALEVILGRVVGRRFAYVVISSVVADFIARAFWGDTPVFIIPEFKIASNWEIIFFIVLGILAALVAVAFIQLMQRSEGFFDSPKIPAYFKPALGGLAVGLIGLYSPDLFGVGYTGIGKAMAGEFVLVTLVALLVLKVIATSFTLGSGGSGGVFAPSLFMGAMLGGIVGIASHNLFPAITGPAGAYSVAGMAAVFAAATRAPFSAILIIVEMTGDYAIILPLMTSVVVSTILARALKRETIYTEKLVRRGIDIRREDIGDLMRTITVRETMTKNFPTVSPDTSIEELLKRFRNTTHHGFPVVDLYGNLVGIVTLEDVERFQEIQGQNLTVMDIATKSPFVVYPDQSLHELLNAVGEDYGRIPVVSREDRNRLVGVIRRYDIIKAYRAKLKEAPPKTRDY